MSDPTIIEDALTAGFDVDKVGVNVKPLAAQNNGEVVAQQRLHPDKGWIHVECEDVEHYKAKGQQVRELYTAAIAAQAASEAIMMRVAEAVKDTCATCKHNGQDRQFDKYPCHSCSQAYRGGDKSLWEPAETIADILALSTTDALEEFGMKVADEIRRITLHHGLSIGDCDMRRMVRDKIGENK